MPRRLLRAPGHDRNRSLGWLATWWIETFVVHGPGPVLGQQVHLTDEYAGFVVDCYALDSRGKRLYDSGFFSRPKGTNKSGLAADLALFEAIGPCRFDGFAVGGEQYTFLGQTYTYEPGEPMGKPMTAPVVRIMATEEEQAGNVFDTVYHNLSSERAPLFRYATAYSAKVGLRGITLPGGGEITPSTAGAASKDGGVETFVVFDETHLYTLPRLRDMYSIVGNNLVKRRAEGTWFLETTTMYQPGEDSVAEATYEVAEAIEDGRMVMVRQLIDHRWGEVRSLRDPSPHPTPETLAAHIAVLEAAFREAYGDTLIGESPYGWVDLESRVQAVFDPRRKESDLRRFFLNAITSSVDAWMDVDVWAAVNIITRLKRGTADGFLPVSDGDRITLGFDGARSNDATALVAVRVHDRHAFPLLIREKPDGPEGEGWTVDRYEVDRAVRAAFERFDVVGFYADPPFWQEVINGWDADLADGLEIAAAHDSAIRYWTKNTTRVARACELVQTAALDGTMTHAGQRQLTRHVLNARVWPRPGGDVIGKETKNSTRKMDAAMALVLAFQAATDWENQQVKEQDGDEFVPIRVR